MTRKTHRLLDVTPGRGHVVGDCPSWAVANDQMREMQRLFPRSIYNIVDIPPRRMYSRRPRHVRQL